MSKKIKVALVGIYFPLAMLRYFERALERRDDIELVTVGPFTGNWIPWNGGMNLLPKYFKSPTVPLPRELIQQGRVNPSLFKQFGVLEDVDLWIEVDAGFHLDPRPTTGIVAHVATDPHALSYDRQRQLSDVFFNMQAIYMKNGDVYLPYAYDPTVHYPMQSKLEFDVCMIGLHYEQRTQLVNRLLNEKLRVHYSIGSVFDEYRELYNKSWIGINWSSKQDLNARVFELAAMGVTDVQNTVPDMKTFFVPGDHYLEFSTLDEAVKQVMRATIDHDMAIEMANAAMRKVEPHTYDARIQTILERCKLI